MRLSSLDAAIMTDLIPSTEYSYRVGNDVDGWSSTFTFRSLPTTDDPSPVTFALVGDWGIHDNSATTLPALENELKSNSIDAVIHVGDIAYDMDLIRGKVGDDFMEAIEPIASAIPYMACPGNHEFNYNFTAFTHRFSGLPHPSTPPYDKIPASLGTNVGGKKNNWFYSFDFKNVHFVSLSTELVVDILDVTNTSRYGFNYPDLTTFQHDWLTQDLKSNSLNPETEWLIVYSHRPMYCSCNDDDCDGDHADAVRNGVPGNTAAGLEQTFKKYGVDIYVSGHMHMYERLLPVFQNVSDPLDYSPDMRTMTNPSAPVHIITGAGGNPEGTDGFPNTTTLPFSAVRAPEWSYSKMIVHNATHLHWQQIGVAGESELVDTMWIVKDI